MFVCYICQLFHEGINYGGTRIDNTLTNITKKKKKFKKGGEEIQNFYLMKNNPFESKELPETESGDVIPVYSGYENPSFSHPLSFLDHLFLPLCFFLYLSLLFLPVHFVISNRILPKEPE